MPQGISKNPLTDISKVYLDKISEGRLKQLEKAAVLSASDDPKDQDEARRIKTKYDYADLKKQIAKKKKPEIAAVAEEVDCECDDCGQDPCIECGESHHNVDEGFSDWRDDLREISGAFGVGGATQTNAGLEQQPDSSRHSHSKIEKIKEKKVKNKIKINPSFQESAEEIAKNLGGQLLEVAEVLDDQEDGEDKDAKKIEMMKRKEKQLKKRMIRMKMMAINQTDGEGIIAGYEPEGEVLDELKTSTLRSYINRASVEAVGRGVDAGIKGMTGPKKEMEKNMTKAYKRMRGINTAANKLASRADRKEEVELDESLGGKGYKRRKDYAGREVSGDWPESDRGEGNKARTTAIKKGIKGVEPVKKKSPTYLAYIKNKKKEVSVLNTEDAQYGYDKDGKSLNPKDDPHRGQGEKIQKRTKKWMDKEGIPGAPGLDAMKARTAEHKAKRGVKEENVFRAAMKKVLKKKEKEEKKPEKATDAGARGRRILQRREYADKVSGSVDLVPDDLRDSVNHHQKDKDGNEIPHEINELNRYGKETGKATGSLNKAPGSPVRKGGSGDRALQTVQRMIRKDYGKPEGQQKKTKGVKSDVGTGKYLAKQKEKRDYAAKARKAGYKNPQDYTNVVARYGGEDNYRRGKGLD